jgi:hypothetical protein
MPGKTKELVPPLITKEYRHPVFILIVICVDFMKKIKGSRMYITGCKSFTAKHVSHSVTACIVI